MKRYLLLLFIVFIIVGCNLVDSVTGDDDDDNDTDGTNGGTVTTGITGSALFDPGISEAIVNSESSNVSAYVVGQKDAKTQVKSDGTFELKVDLSIQPSVLFDPEATAQQIGSRAGDETIDITGYQLIIETESGNYGKKVNNITVTQNNTTAVGDVTLEKTGSISGKVTLQNLSDYANIDVYIPGTSYIAKTDSSGNYTISNIPPGTYQFVRADADGYIFSIISNVVVEPELTTTIEQMDLYLTTGVSEAKLILDDEYTVATSRTVELDIVVEEGIVAGKPVLMMIAETSDFLNATWQPLESKTSYTFDSDGSKTLYIKFANANGLESGVFSASIIVNTTPMVNIQAPISNSTVNNTMPEFRWDRTNVDNARYKFQLATSLDFATIIDESIDTFTDNTTYISYTTDVTLNNLATYYWRIAIVDENDTVWDWMIGKFNTDLSVVTLSSPTGTITNTKPTLDWGNTDLPNATYHVQLASGSDFSTIIEETTDLTLSTYTITSATLDNLTTYYYRVKVIDENDVEGAWAGPQSFSIDLGTVTFSVPADATIDNTKPTFDWSDSALPGVTYHFQLASDTAFNTIVEEATALSSSTYTITTATLDNLTTYYYRVKVIDENSVQGEWTTTHEFDIDLGTVTFTAPTDATIDNTKPAFDWTDSTLTGVTYHFQLASDNTFSTIIEEATALTASTYTITTATLDHLATYYYRVKVIDENSVQGEWTATLDFGINLGSVTFTAPTDATIDNTKPTFDWTDSSLPSVTYYFQLASDNTFSTIIEESTALTASTYTITTATLDHLATYYYRVKVIDENGMDGTWSTVGEVAIDIGTVSLTSPIYQVLINDTTPALIWAGNTVATTYNIVLSTNADLSVPVLSHTGISNTSYTLTAPEALALTASTMYYWAVTPVDTNSVAGTQSSIGQFELDTTAPNSCTITINNGFLYANEKSFTLALSAADTNSVQYMRIAETEEGLTGATYVTYATSSSLTVSAGDGVRYVYVQYKDYAGNESTPVSDTITLEEAVVYVKTDGNDTNYGTRDNPLLTISSAISKAGGFVTADVRVAEGTYSVTSSMSLYSDTSLYGGYSSSDWDVKDHTLYPTKISYDGIDYISSLINCISGTSTIDGFILYIHSLDGGGSQYGIAINANITVSNNIILTDKQGSGFAIGVNLTGGSSQIYNNIIYAGVTSGFTYGIEIRNDSTAQIYNNTLILLPRGGSGTAFRLSDTAAPEIINNITHNFATFLYENSYTSDPVKLQNNNASGTSTYYYDKDTLSNKTLAEAEALTDTDASGNTEVSLTSNFTDIDGADNSLYTPDDNNVHIPTASTDVIQGGQDLSAVFTTDFDGTARIAPWSMGAYEH